MYVKGLKTEKYKIATYYNPLEGLRQWLIRTLTGGRYDY
jgi:hypothetical protein